MNKKYKLSFNSPVILTFVFICFAALVAGYITGGLTTTAMFSVYRSSFTNPFTYIRFIGHVFGHAGFSHFINNMMMILVVGPLLEERYGSKKIIEIIVITALITGVVHFILFPRYALLGASGVVFAFIILSSITDIREGEIPITLILVAALYLGQQVYDGLFVADNVSNLTHIIGGIIGGVIGMSAKQK